MTELREMSELRELTDRELDVVGGGILNNKNFGEIEFNNALNVVGSQIGQQVNGVFSLNGIGVVA